MDKHRTRLRQYANDYLRQHPCMDCGEADPTVLDFDHRDGMQKLSSISRIIFDGMSMARLIAEIAKCDIRCANCHRRRHAKDKQAFKKNRQPSVVSPEGRESIRQSKLGIARSEETKAKISESLKGNHCRPMLQLAGRRFGRLVVAENWEKRGGRVWWLCRCDCGSPEKWIKSVKLTTGKTQSCGCLRNYYYGNGSPSIIENSGNPRAEAGAHQLESAEVCACSLD